MNELTERKARFYESVSYLRILLGEGKISGKQYKNICRRLENEYQSELIVS